METESPAFMGKLQVCRGCGQYIRSRLSLIEGTCKIVNEEGTIHECPHDFSVSPVPGKTSMDVSVQQIIAENVNGCMK